jgi:hypothetical protein
MARFSRFFCVLSVLLASCQPLPRPFQPDDKAIADFAAFGIADKLVVFVAGIDDAPVALDRAVSDALAERLRRQGIVASTASANRGSLLLICTARATETGNIKLAWRLIDADGLVIGLVDQYTTATTRDWLQGEPILVEAIVAEAAPRIAAIVGDHDPSMIARGTPGLLRPVHVDSVTGAPGDGDKSLTKALRNALRRAGLTVADQPEALGVSVFGTVERTPLGEADEIAVRWRVVSPEGAELGSISQGNFVPTGSLDGPWGNIALAVAQGGAEGVIQILSEIGAPAPDREEN